MVLPAGRRKEFPGWLAWPLSLCPERGHLSASRLRSREEGLWPFTHPTAVLGQAQLTQRVPAEAVILLPGWHWVPPDRVQMEGPELWSWVHLCKPRQVTHTCVPHPSASVRWSDPIQFILGLSRMDQDARIVIVGTVVTRGCSVLSAYPLL